MTSNNNVTPFRPRPPEKQPDRRPSNIKDPHIQAMLVHALSVASFAILFFTWGELFNLLGIGIGFAALAIAASRRTEAPSWAATHHEFGLRTVLIGGIVWMLSSLLAIVPALGGLLVWAVHIGVLGWAGLRSGFAILRARERAPMVRPRSFLF